MCRTGVLLLTAVVMIGAVALGGSAVAQDSTPVAPSTDHPIVGSWMIDTEPQNPTNPLHLTIISADGSYLESETDGGVSVGVWEATGDNTAIFSFRFLAGPQGMGTIRAEAEVAEDGQTFTANFTLELVAPDGTSTGEVGPGMAEATRLTVEAPGTPVGSFEDVLGAPPATPEG